MQIGHCSWSGMAGLLVEPVGCQDKGDKVSGVVVQSL